MVALFWGGTVIATRVAAQTFGPFTGASLRYVVACILFIPLAFAINRKAWRITGRQFLNFTLLGFSGIFLYNFFFFKGLKLVPASHGGLLLALNPSMVLISSAIIFREKITRQKMAGVLLSLAGVILVISRGNLVELFSGLQLGDAYMLGCPIAWTIYTLTIRSALHKTTPIEASAWASFTGLLLLLLFTFSEPFPEQVPVGAWTSILYLGTLGTVLAFIWYYEGVRILGPSKTAIFNNLVPVFSLLLSVIILREKVDWYTWAGAGLVVAGIIISNRYNKASGVRS